MRNFELIWLPIFLATSGCSQSTRSVAPEKESKTNIAHIFDTVLKLSTTNAEFSFNVPEPNDFLMQVREEGEPIVTLCFDGAVIYNTNKVDESTRKFWEVFSLSFPEMRRRIMWEELAKLKANENK